MDTSETDIASENDWLLSIEVGLLAEEVDRLQSLLLQSPNLRVKDMLFPSTDSHELQVREAMFQIFSRVGEIIGRNSPQAIEADLILFLKRNKESLKETPKNIL